MNRRERSPEIESDIIRRLLAAEQRLDGYLALAAGQAAAPSDELPWKVGELVLGSDAWEVRKRYPQIKLEPHEQRGPLTGNPLFVYVVASIDGGLA